MIHSRRFIIWFCLLPLFTPLFSGCQSSPKNQSLANEYFVIGNDYYEMGNYEKAEEFFLKALAIDPKFKKLNYNLARVYLENGRYSQGREILLELLDIDKENQKILETVGYSYYLEKKFDLAADYYLQVLQANKMDTTARFNLAVIRKNQQKNDEALALFLALEEENITDIKTLHYNIAEIYETLEEKEKAIEYYEKSLSQSPDKKALLEKLIVYYKQEKLYNKVIEKMDAITPLLPAEEQAEYLFEKGELTLLKTDDYSAGLATVKEALTKGFDDIKRYNKLVKDIEDPDIKESLLTILKEHKSQKDPEKK